MKAHTSHPTDRSTTPLAVHANISRITRPPIPHDTTPLRAGEDRASMGFEGLDGDRAAGRKTHEVANPLRADDFGDSWGRIRTGDPGIMSAVL